MKWKKMNKQHKLFSNRHMSAFGRCIEVSVKYVKKIIRGMVFFFDKNQICDNRLHNQPSEQIRSDFGLEIADDQVLSPQKQRDALTYYLGEEQCSIETIFEKKVFVYQQNGKKYILLHKAISYLGNPHPIFKKRIQMPSWWQEFCIEASKAKLDYDIRFVGVYHYQKNIIFVDFAKDTYLQHGLHNSSAHVYTNDLYQAVRNGVFHREDQYGNHIYSVRAKDFEDYLLGNKTGDNELFELFAKFNNGFSFGQWLYAVDKIKEMYGDGWRQWKQTEWAGWFLEYKFDQFVKNNKLTSVAEYVGSTHKGHKEGIYDFDLWFGKSKFYGDLKASDIAEKVAIGNDQQTFIECIDHYGKFWYVIYEHMTRKDSAETLFQATKERDEFIRSIGLPVSEHSENHRYIKHSVNFVRMSIFELNNINFRDALTEFNQGKQPDGSPRKKKFSIKKKEADNFVVYRYTYKEA